MSTSLRLRCSSALAGGCLLCTIGALLAQTPVPPVPPPAPPVPPLTGAPSVPRRTVIPAGGGAFQPGQPGQFGQLMNQIAILSRNYLVTLKVKNGDAAETVEVLTASPTLSFNCVLGKSPSTLVTFSGTLQESEDGSLVLQYSVGGRVPEVLESSAPAQPGSGVGAMPARIEYKDETSSGAIHVTAGEEQVLLKSGQRCYSIRIAPAVKAQ